MAAKTFQELLVWQKAHALVLRVYALTARFPREEMFGLTSQLRRAAVSVPANIAEGFGRMGKADKAKFYNIAQASLDECRYYLILAADLRYADSPNLAEQMDEVGRMLDSYSRAVTASRFSKLPRTLPLFTTAFCLLSTAFSKVSA